MKRKQVLALVALSILALLIPSSLAPLATSSISAAYIQLSNDSGVAYWYFRGFIDGDQLGTVLSPEPGWYLPFQVMSVEATIGQYAGATDSVTVQAHIYSLIDGEVGVKLGSSVQVETSTFFPNWITLDLSSENIFLDDDFVAVIEYKAGESGSVPSGLWDDSIQIPIGTNFYFWTGTGWVEHYDFFRYAEAYGFLMIRATVDVPGEPQPPTPTPTPTPNILYLPAQMKNYDPSVPTSTPTPTYTPIPRPTMVYPTVIPLIFESLIESPPSP